MNAHNLKKHFVDFPGYDVKIYTYPAGTTNVELSTTEEFMPFLVELANYMYENGDTCRRILFDWERCIISVEE